MTSEKQFVFCNHNDLQYLRLNIQIFDHGTTLLTLHYCCYKIGQSFEAQWSHSEGIFFRAWG